MCTANDKEKKHDIRASFTDRSRQVSFVFAWLWITHGQTELMEFETSFCLHWIVGKWIDSIGFFCRLLTAQNFSFSTLLSLIVNWLSSFSSRLPFMKMTASAPAHIFKNRNIQTHLSNLESKIIQNRNVANGSWIIVNWIEMVSRLILTIWKITNKNFKYGGTLISMSTVTTAAHCLYELGRPRIAERVIVPLGKLNLEIAGPNTEYVRVSCLSPHHSPQVFPKRPTQWHCADSTSHGGNFYPLCSTDLLLGW